MMRLDPHFILLYMKWYQYYPVLSYIIFGKHPSLTYPTTTHHVYMKNVGSAFGLSTHDDRKRDIQSHLVHKNGSCATKSKLLHNNDQSNSLWPETFCVYRRLKALLAIF